MVRWDPWRDLFALEGELNRLMRASWAGPAERGEEQEAYLPVDIRQADGEFQIEASVPGFSPEEIEVTADQGVLTVRGQHKSEVQKEGEFLRRERRERSFFRQLSLPQDVEQEKISASFLNGVLTVKLPRSQAPTPKRIEVAVGAPRLEVEGGKLETKVGASSQS